MAEQTDKDWQENWVRDLFPAKFSAEDIFESSNVMPMETRCDKGIYAELYKNVLLGYCENAADIPYGRSKGNKPVQSDCKQMIPENPQQEHIWTAEDISTIIRSYDHLKKKAVQLICIVETKSIKVRMLKAKLHEASMDVEKVQVEQNDLRKVNAQLEATVKKFERIVTEQEKQRNCLESQVNLQATQILDLKKLLLDATMDIRKQNELIFQLERQLDLSKKQCKKESFKEVERINVTYEVKISELEARIQNLSEKLATYRDKYCSAEKSLKALQLHFEGMKPVGNSYPEQQNSLSHFIDVVDFT